MSCFREWNLSLLLLGFALYHATSWSWIIKHKAKLSAYISYTNYTEFLPWLILKSPPNYNFFVSIFFQNRVFFHYLFILIFSETSPPGPSDQLQCGLAYLKARAPLSSWGPLTSSRLFLCHLLWLISLFPDLIFAYFLVQAFVLVEHVLQLLYEKGFQGGIFWDLTYRKSLYSTLAMWLLIYLHMEFWPDNHFLSEQWR